MIFVEEKSMRLLCVFSCLWSKNVHWNLVKSGSWNFTLSCWDACHFDNVFFTDDGGYVVFSSLTPKVFTILLVLQNLQEVGTTLLKIQ